MTPLRRSPATQEAHDDDEADDDSLDGHGRTASASRRAAASGDSRFAAREAPRYVPLRWEASRASVARTGHRPFDQPAAEHSRGTSRTQAHRVTLPAGDEASRLFAELCERVPDAEARASLVGVTVELDEAWRQGKRLPLLRAHRKRIERALNAAPSA